MSENEFDSTKDLTPAADGDSAVIFKAHLHGANEITPVMTKIHRQRNHRLTSLP